jgi:hypothetical protein
LNENISPGSSRVPLIVAIAVLMLCNRAVDEADAFVTM